MAKFNFRLMLSCALIIVVCFLVIWTSPFNPDTVTAQSYYKSNVMQRRHLSSIHLKENDNIEGIGNINNDNNLNHQDIQLNTQIQKKRLVLKEQMNVEMELHKLQLAQLEILKKQVVEQDIQKQAKLIKNQMEQHKDIASELARQEQLLKELDYEKRQSQKSDAPCAGNPKKENNLAIVYLTKNTKADKTYGRNSNALLEKSLHLLQENVLAKNPADVLIFHEGDFTEPDQKALTDKFPFLKFHQLCDKFWGAPPQYINVKEHSTWKFANRYGVGYRNMMHFYAIDLWNYLDDMGYQHTLRLDEESFIHSPVNYNMVDYLKRYNISYAYRQDQVEDVEMQVGWPEALRSFIVNEAIEPTFLFDNCMPRNITGLATGSHNRQAYYNNFFLTSIAFWKSKQVQKFLNFVDRSGGLYRYRWGDALVHTAAVQMFLFRDQVHKFSDFTYEHSTLNKKDNSLVWGGMSTGTHDPIADSRLEQFRKDHGTETIFVY